MQTILTKVGLEKVKAELENVKTVKVPYAENRLKQAAKFGNGEEVEDAKAERAFYKKKIVVLERMVKTAKII